MTIADCYCYCCTCADPGWDPACRNHGAHGVRACERHGLPGADCDCGCDDPDPAGFPVQVHEGDPG